MSSNFNAMVQILSGNYADLTVKQLQEIASGMQIPGCWKMRKAELCAAIDMHEQPEPEEDGELRGFGCVERYDWEVEREVKRMVLEADFMGFPVPTQVVELDDGCDISHPYWTKSGETPVTESIAAQADKRSRNLYEVEAPDKKFYSAAKMYKYGNGRKQERTFHTIIRFIEANKDNPERLRAGWKRFWTRCFNSNQNFVFLFPKQIKSVRSHFEKYGMKSKNSR